MERRAVEPQVPLHLLFHSTFLSDDGDMPVTYIVNSIVHLFPRSDSWWPKKQIANHQIRLVPAATEDLVAII